MSCRHVYRARYGIVRLNAAPLVPHTAYTWLWRGHTPTSEERSSYAPDAVNTRPAGERTLWCGPRVPSGGFAAHEALVAEDAKMTQERLLDVHVCIRVRVRVRPCIKVTATGIQLNRDILPWFGNFRTRHADR